MNSRNLRSCIVLIILLIFASVLPAQEPARLSIDTSLHFISGAQTIIPVRLTSEGGERTISFSLGWDIGTNVRYVRVDLAAGSPSDTVITVNSSRTAAGRVGITMTSATGFGPGSKLLANVITQGGQPEVFPLRIDYINSPTPIRVTDLNNEARPIVTSGFTFSSMGIADPGMVLSVGQIDATAGRTVTLPVRYSRAFGGFDGTTNVSFSIQWDSEFLEYRAASPGDLLPPGSLATFDESMVAQGRLGVSITGTSPFIDSVISYRPAKVTFQVRSTAPVGLYPISFTNSPTPYRASTASGQPTYAAWSPGFVNNGVYYAYLEGRVRTPGGLALRNAIVELVDDDGVKRTATTNSFGTFIFMYVPNISPYTIVVRSKRYRFPTVPYVAVAGLPSPIDIWGLE